MLREVTGSKDGGGSNISPDVEVALRDPIISLETPKATLGEDVLGILCRICIVHTILQQVQGHTETGEAEFLVETEFLEPEEIFANIFSKISADKLLAVVIECTRPIGTSIAIEGGSLFVLGIFVVRIKGCKNLPKALPGGFCIVHA